MGGNDGMNRTARRWSGADVAALLADGDFARVWTAGALLGVVRWLEALAIGIFVIDRTGSAAAVAVVGFARMLPMLLLGAPMGALTGRFRRRSLLLAATAAAGLAALILGGLALAGAVAVWQIALGSFLTGILWTADFPARRTILADIAGPARTGTAMALDSTTGHVTRLLGAALGGLLIGAVGLAGAYLLGAATYALVVVLLKGLSAGDAPAPGPHRGLWTDTLGGLREVTAERFLRVVLVVTVIFNFFGFSYTSMVPVIGRGTLHADAFSVGLLVSAEAIASLVTSLALAALTPRRWLGALYAGAVLAFLAGVLAFALSPAYAISLAAMTLTGLAWGVFSMAQSTVMLLASPPRLKARAMGTLAICIGLAPLGMLHLGWLAECLGAPAAVAISAIEGAVALVAVAALYPRLLGPELPAAGDTGRT